MPLLTPRDVATRLGVSYSTVKQWIYRGLVRTTVTGGGHHRVAESEVLRLLGAQGKVPKPRGSRPRSGVLVAVSGRNQLRGIVEEIRVDGLLAQVLDAMGAVSPAYVQRLLPYAEALVRLEDLLGTSAPEGRDVVVHCHGGRSRTALVMKALAMRHHGWTEQQAHEWLLEQWPHYGLWNRSFRTVLQDGWA